MIRLHTKNNVYKKSQNLPNNYKKTILVGQLKIVLYNFLIDTRHEN